MGLSEPIPSATGLTLGGKTCFNACGYMSDYTCVFSPDGRSFGTLGWIMDAVEVLCTPSSIDEDETKRVLWLRDVWNWAPRNRPQDLYPIIAGETILIAYWRIITTHKKRDVRIVADDPENTSCNALGDRELPEEQEQLPGSRFGISKRGAFNVLPTAAREGNLLVLLLGAKVPHMLWPTDPTSSSEGPQPTCTLVGEAYIHGFMDGQAALRFAEKMVEGRSSGRDMLAIGQDMLTMSHTVSRERT